MSESVIFCPFLCFVQHSPIIEEIYSYLSLVKILSASSSKASSSSFLCADTSGTLFSFALILLSFSSSLMAKKRRWHAGTLLSSFAATACTACSASLENLCTKTEPSCFCASSTAFCAAFWIPVPFNAEISSTSQPRFCPSLSVCIFSPDFSRISAIFTAISTGMPSSKSCVDRYRFRSRLVPSTMFKITSGRSSIR